VKTILITAHEIELAAEYARKHGQGLYTITAKPTGIADVIEIQKNDSTLPQDITNYGVW
jgi:hypothetical protein